MQRAVHARMQDSLVLYRFIIRSGCHSEHVTCANSPLEPQSIALSRCYKSGVEVCLPRAPLAAMITWPHLVPIVATLHPCRLRREMTKSGDVDSCSRFCSNLSGMLGLGMSVLYVRDCRFAARRLLHNSHAAELQVAGQTTGTALTRQQVAITCTI